MFSPCTFVFHSVIVTLSLTTCLVCDFSVILCKGIKIITLHEVGKMRFFLTFCLGFLGVLNFLHSQKAQNWAGTNNGRIYFQSNSGHLTTFRAPLNQSSSIHYILPRNPPLAGEALVHDNSGELVWRNVYTSAGDIGSGTPASGAFTSLSANNNFSVYPIGTGAGNTGEIRWYELAANGSEYTAFKAADAMSSNIVYTLPSSGGSSGNILTTNGSGQLSWSASVSGTNVSASGNLSVSGNSALGDANTDVTSLKGTLRVYDTDGQEYTDIKGPSGASQTVNLNFTLPSNAGSANNMLITDGSGNLSWSSAVNGSTVTASGDISSGGNGAITGDLAVGGNTSLGNASSDVTNLKGSFRVWDNNNTHWTDIKGGDGTAQIADLNFILPTDAGSNGKVLTTNGSGTLSWSTPSPDWTTPGTIGSTTPNTGAFTTLSANGALSLKPTGTSSGNTGEIRWYELVANGSNYTAFRAADDMLNPVVYTLPAADGSSGNMLTTNGSGVLSWSSSVSTTNVTASGDLTVNGNTSLGDASTDVTNLKGSFRVWDNNNTHYTDIKGGDGTAQIAHLDFILPTNAGAANNMLITDGSGNLSWSSSVSGTNVTASGDLSVGGNTSLGDASTDVTNLKGSFRVWDNNNTHYTDIKGGDGTAQIAHLDFILPTNAGAANNMLITDGSGNLSWSSSVSGTNVTASGDLSVGGNTSLGDASTDVTNLKGSFRVWDNDNTHYTDIKGGDGTAQIANLDFILPTTAGSNGQVLSTNGSGTLSWVTATPNWAAPGTIGSTTPNSGAFTTLSASGALTASGNINIQPTGASAGNTGEIRWYDLDASNFTAFKAADVMGADVTYTLPAADGTSGQSLTTNGSGVLSWSTTSANWASPGTIGSTTPNTGAFTTLSASNNINVSPTGTSAGNTGEIRWYELVANGSDYTAFKAADAMAAPVTYTLPAADGTAGQFLKTNGSGTLSWAAGSSGADASFLQTYAVSASAPSTGDALVWNGTAWAPGNATSSVQKLVLSEGTELDIDILRGGASEINNTNISAHAFFKMVNAGINTDINGFANGENGRIIYLFNSTTKNIVFVEQDPASLAVNRLILGVANKTINPDQVAVFIYSTTKNRWILISTT